MFEYRKQAGQVAKDTSWTIWRFLPVTLLVVAILMAAGWGVKSAGIIGKDIDREVVQHSRQYVESKQAKLQNLHSQYMELETKIAEAEAVEATKVVDAAQAQQRAIKSQIKRETTNIPKNELPTGIHRLLMGK